MSNKKSIAAAVNAVIGDPFLTCQQYTAGSIEEIRFNRNAFEG